MCCKYILIKKKHYIVMQLSKFYFQYKTARSSELKQILEKARKRAERTNYEVNNEIRQ